MNEETNDIVYVSRETRELNTRYEITKKGAGRYAKSIKPINQTETTSQRKYVTHTQHPLTFREARFIDLYMTYADGGRAVEEAGFKVKNKAGKARELLKRDYISEEIDYRTEIYASECIATRDEVLGFYTASMRGEIKDQFGLDATLTDRLRAADSLKKILIDDVEKRNSTQAQQVVVNIAMDRDAEPETTVDIQQISD